MFKRKIYKEMLKWKKESDGKTALLIEGARRVGKSTVTLEFAKNEYDSYIFIDFAQVSQDIKQLFDDVSDLNYLFLQLQLYFNVELVKRRSLIVFDEVQLCPKARQSIKALVSDGRYDYIETGSLISIKKNIENILIPSEEHRIEMFPMDYEEFLWATGNEACYSMLKKTFEDNLSIGNAQNRQQLKNFRLYMLVGGMPQAICAYIESNNFKTVDSVKRDIIDLYKADFAKIDPSGKLSLMFDAIPAQLSKNASRFQTKSITGVSNNDKKLEMIAQLKDSKTVLVSYNVSDPNVGLSSTINLNSYKLFCADTGLFVTLMFKDKSFTDNVIYKKLLTDKLSANLGYLYENIVAQCLYSKKNSLYYHTMYDEANKRNYEIDFLLSRGHKIVPIEVKSSGYKTHISLDKFKEKYLSRIGDSYLIYSKERTKDRDITCLPYYYVPFL